MTPEDATALFTRSDGTYLFARWGRPIAPVIFGVQDETLSIFKGAIEALVTLSGHEMAETDPELGANLMIFFLRDWQELVDTRTSTASWPISTRSYQGSRLQAPTNTAASALTRPERSRPPSSSSAWTKTWRSCPPRPSRWHR